MHRSSVFCSVSQSALEVDRYRARAARGMYAAEHDGGTDVVDDDGLTAFRRAEKRYKLHRTQIVRTRADGRRKGGALETRLVDLSAVVDTLNLASLAREPGTRVSVHGASSSKSEVHERTHPAAYAIDGHPGAVLVPNALSVDEQREWVRIAVTESCEPPARTNHDAALGPLKGLWREAHARPSRYVRVPSTDEGAGRGDTETETGWRHISPEPTGGDPRVNLAATRLLEKMRWATIGPPYDWSARAYDTDAPRRPVNPRWLERCVDLAEAAGAAGDFAGEFAGLVNYYRSGDQLAGHVDDAEVDMSKPIVSVSLGCPCVFLLGGRSRDVAPTAVLMRSGDAVVLTGPSRRCYHGVPRIFVSGEGCVDGDGVRLGCPEWLGNPDAWPEEPDVARYIAGGRVNVSVRVVD